MPVAALDDRAAPGAHALHGRAAPWAGVDARRAAPLALAVTLAVAYVVLSPPTPDLAAQLFRADLFRQEGFALWNNLWYSGHDLVGYSVLFPALAALLTPQLAAALAAIATAALFEPLARRHFGPDAWLGATAFAAATAISLFTGRLTLALGALPALGAVVALDAEAPFAAGGLATLSALCSPVAALFTALAALGHATARVHRRARPGTAIAALGTAAAALVPLAAIGIAFPEGGREPFALSTLWPLVLICSGALLAVPGRHAALRGGVAIYAAAVILVFLVPSPIGSNIARLGTALAAPLAALLWWPRHRWWLAVLALPLLYVGWYPPLRDALGAASDPAANAAFYRPLLRFLRAQAGPPFRIEIPFTASHYEAYVVGLQFPLARGWERQLDVQANPLFYGRPLTADVYDHWLHATAVRFVALPTARLDYSARAEVALIRRGLPYLRLVMRARDWRVYAVVSPTPIVTGPATLDRLGADTIALTALRPGTITVHVNYTPYWALTRGRGCVAPAGRASRLTVSAAGPVTLTTQFGLARVRATAPRCRG